MDIQHEQMASPKPSFTMKGQQKNGGQTTPRSGPGIALPRIGTKGGVLCGDLPYSGLRDRQVSK